MSTLFLRLVSMSAVASLVIAAVLLLRLLLRRAPKKYSYLLWSVVGFRLCCPVSPRSPFSLLRLLPAPASQALTEGRVFAPAAVPETVLPALGGESAAAPASFAPAGSAALPALSASPAASAPAAAVKSGAAAAEVLAWIWLALMAAMLLYGLAAYLGTRRRMATAVRLEGNVFQAEGLSSPFLLGFFRPRICLPYGLEGESLALVLAHERCHLRRGDHWFKLFAWLLLCVHWFNPLCWLAFFLMSRDMEMSCDESVLAAAGSRKAYSAALLGFAAGRRFPAPNPLAFGETGAKSRIRNALAWKRAKKWVTVAAVTLCLALIAACAADPLRTETEELPLALNADGTLGALRWGMTLEEAAAAEPRIDFSAAEARGMQGTVLTLPALTLFGQEAAAELTFWPYSRELNLDPLGLSLFRAGQDTEPILGSIVLSFPAADETLSASLTALFGEAETGRLHYRYERDAQGTLLSSGVFFDREQPLPEEQRYWHSESFFTDLVPMERLRALCPEAEEDVLLRKVSFLLAWRVTPERDGETLTLACRGDGLAAERALDLLGSAAVPTTGVPDAEALTEEEQIDLLREQWRSVLADYLREHPDADIYPVTMTPLRDENGQICYRVECDGVDVAALESSGLLPAGVQLEYPADRFNQKLSHEVPHEPESQTFYDGGMTILTASPALYPLYPDRICFTVQCRTRLSRSFNIVKYADGEWHSVRTLGAGTLEFQWIEPGENRLEMPLEHYARLGEGLYRLYVNETHWVEFAVSASAPPLPASPSLPAFVYQGSDPYLPAVCEWMLAQAGGTPAAGEVVIPSPVILAVDASNGEDVLVWGNFWQSRYTLVSTTLLETGGGEQPGLLHLRRTAQGYAVTSAELVGDGSAYAEDSERLFGMRPGLLAAFRAAGSEAREAAQLQFVGDYVSQNGLAVTQLQAFGWAPVPLPGAPPTPETAQRVRLVSPLGYSLEYDLREFSYAATSPNSELLGGVEALQGAALSAERSSESAETVAAALAPGLTQPVQESIALGVDGLTALCVYDGASSEDARQTAYVLSLPDGGSLILRVNRRFYAIAREVPGAAEALQRVLDTLRLTGE